MPADHGQVAHPDIGKRHAIIRIAEVGLHARDDEVEAGLQPLRRGDIVAAFVIVRRLRQVGRPFEFGLAVRQIIAVGVVHLLRAVAILRQSRYPIGLHRAEVNLVEILVLHPQHGQWIGPNSLGQNLQTGGFDLLNEIVAEFTAVALREGVLALNRDLAGFDEFILALYHDCEPVARHRRQFVIGPLVRERLQRRFVTRRLLFADRKPVRELQPR